MKKFPLHHFWLVLAAYGVWFAILSGLEEASNGKFWKAVLSLVLGTVTYYTVEARIKNR